MKCNIIICGPAVGKTYLANIDNRFFDLDFEKAKYKYGIDKKISVEEFEKIKFSHDIINNDSVEYAINLLEQKISEGKIILMSFNKKIIEYIKEKKYTYCLVYPNISSYDEYLARMKNRGNTESFINKTNNEEDWNRFYLENKNDKSPNYKIELKNGEYLSDIVKYFF